MGNWHHYLRVFVLFFGVLLFSGCGGCFGKMTAGELACEGLSIESTTVEPYSWATLYVDFAEKLPEDVDKIEVTAELTMADWEPAPVALRSLKEDSLQWHVPFFITDPMAGGAATLQLTFSDETCNPINIEIAPLAPAPGATLELMAKTTQLIEADSAAYGIGLAELTDAVNFETLEFDTSLPLPVWAHALSIATTDHPDLETSFYGALENELSDPDAGEWATVLDAIIAASYDFDEMESLIEWTNNNPVENLSFGEYDPSLILQQNTGIPIFLPVIGGPKKLSELMVYSATRCAVHESGVISDAMMNALSTANPLFEGLRWIVEAEHGGSIETLNELEETITGEEWATSNTEWAAEHVSMFERIKFLQDIFSAFTAMDRAFSETMRGGCQLLPSQVDSLSGDTPWWMNEDTDTPLELTPLSVTVSSQEYELPNFIEITNINMDYLPNPIWDFFTSMEKQAETYRFVARVLVGDSVRGESWYPFLTEADYALADFLRDVADELDNFRTLGPFYWSVLFPETTDGTNEWVDVKIGRGVVTEHSCGSSQGYCVVPNQRVGSDWVNMSLNAALFPEWRNVAGDLNAAELEEMSFEDLTENLQSDRPSFTSLTESVDVRPILIELIPRRVIGAKPGDLIHFEFVIRNADYPDAEWLLSDGTFSTLNHYQHGAQHLISGPNQNERYAGDYRGDFVIEVPTDAGFAFPISVRGETLYLSPWMDPNRDRSTTGYIDGDRAYIVPKVACLEEGQQVSVQLFGRYQEDNQVRWSASAGSIEARDDNELGVDRALYTAPGSQEDEIIISATVTGRSSTGVPLESTAEVTYSMDCKCWWTAEFEGGAAGTMGGYKATVGQGLFQQIMGSHTVSLTDENSEDGLMLGFPGQDNLVGNSLDASLHIFAEREDLLGGSLIEADMARAYGLDLPKEIFFSGYHEPYYSGRFTGRTLTMVEVLLHQLWQREPIPTTVTATFFADSKNDCKTRRWFN